MAPKDAELAQVHGEKEAEVAELEALKETELASKDAELAQVHGEIASLRRGVYWCSLGASVVAVCVLLYSRSRSR